MKSLKLFTLAFAFTALLASQAVAQVTELKFGHVGAPGSLFAISAEEFARRVNQRLAGKVKVNVFGSSQLGKDKELLQKLKLGTIDFALPSTVMSSVVDAFGLFEMPYMVKSRSHGARIINDIFWPQLSGLVAERGYKIIGVWENGFRHITNNTRPINVPADLQGIKLRTPKGKWRVKMFKSYGANPTPMSFSEVFVALQTGVMDGQENPFAQIYSAKFHEVQKYLTLTGHVYTPAYVTVGADKWAKLPDDVRSALEDIAGEMQSYVYARAAELEIELLANLRAGGMAINTADKAAFIAASKGIYDEYASTVEGGAEMIAKAQSLAD
ncbi:MAG: TRAP transporter substrate-binding protein [Alphaproteobacteria bacterium]|nr:TRAP transporter substrate-binding protein [Alphaproteobacteria bacterium]